MKIALTGATGGLGRAVADAALARGFGVRALVRDVSAAEGLRRAGVELVRGDLANHAALVDAARGADVFVHSAAHVGDWGPREEFERINVGGTENAVRAAAEAGVKRFVHVSSVAVYGRPRTGIITERYPIHPVGTPYEDTKMSAESLAFALGHRLGLEVTAIRPPVIFGEYDRVFLPRVIRQLKKRVALLIDGGHGRFNTVDVRDVVDVLFRSATHPGAVGEVFNVASVPPRVADLFNTIADAAGAPRPGVSVPRPAAMAVARVVDRAYRLARAANPPPVTPFVVTMMSLDVVYDATKARDVLGWPGAGSPLDRLRELARTASTSA